MPRSRPPWAERRPWEWLRSYRVPGHRIWGGCSESGAVLAVAVTPSNIDFVDDWRAVDIAVEAVLKFELVLTGIVCPETADVFSGSAGEPLRRGTWRS